MNLNYLINRKERVYRLIKKINICKTKSSKVSTLRNLKVENYTLNKRINRMISQIGVC